MRTRREDPEHALTQVPGVPRLHLRFLDGMRGLAALYVVFFHLVYQEAMRYGPALAPSWHGALAWLGRGRYAVAVFIVLSGYCLMLPVARTGQSCLPGGLGQFFRRRARRILPPYYAALAITLLLLFLTDVLKRSRGGSAGQGVDGWNLLAHLLLVHDLRADWAQTIDPPMWSVAVEWHIYWLFPTLLLPLWRRIGSLPTVALALGLGLIPHYLLPPGQNFDWARPWYLGLFSMGMAAAALSFAQKPRLPGWLAPPSSLLFYGLAGALAWLAIGGLPYSPAWRWLGDVAIGGAAACLILGCVRTVASGKPAPAFTVPGLLESRCAGTLGSFSYSLYLLHLPVWWVLQPVFRALPLSPGLAVMARLVFGVPLVLAACYGFYLLVEKRFSPGVPKVASQLETAAVPELLATAEAR